VEMQGVGAGLLRARIAEAREKEQESNTGYGVPIVKRAIDPLAQAIREFVETIGKKGRGRRAVAYPYLKQFDPEVVAFITIKSIVNGISNRRRSMLAVSRAIANQLQNELQFNAFMDQNPGLFQTIMRRLRKSSHRGYQTKVLKQAAGKHEIDFEPWSEAHAAAVGFVCVELAREVTGLIETPLRQVSRRKRSKFIQPTSTLMEWINSRVSYLELISPIYLPMLMQPKKWTDPFNGGYYTGVVRNVRFIKTTDRPYLAEVQRRWDNMPMVVDAVNTIQNTGWHIRKDVLEVAEYAWDKGIAISKLPSVDDIPLPSCPVCGRTPNGNHECFIDNAELLTKWKRDANAVYTENAKIKSRRIQARQILWIADKFQNEKAIYFPHNLDFRGRNYPLPMFLHPQGNDLAKSLLSFANGKPIEDATAAGWLAIHGAGVFGHDKVSLEDRIRWVEENETRILLTAADPWSDRWWTEADKPWQFLAFCFEWRDFQQKGYGFVSRLPVALDGSCNGLQHFSAMLRDPIGGRETNLLPADIPADIYQRIADKTTKKLSHSNDLLARQWLNFGVSRKVTKRPVMIMPYSGTLHACRRYIQDYIKEEYSKPKVIIKPWDRDEIAPAATFLASRVWDSIDETVVAARDAMKWLQKAARMVTNEGFPITWTTPIGLYVKQSYNDTSTQRITLRLGDTIRYDTVIAVPNDSLDMRRQVNGLPPNFVHSMDGAALQLSIAYAKDYGISEFAMVHDSYGAPAADADKLGMALRLAFVDLYEGRNVLADLRNHLQLRLKDELPPVPEMGDLDLNLILESDFFFA